ncbi:hypothetical protein K8S17_00075 [bacterium]|nr:hypothetical protein [bacterium]
MRRTAIAACTVSLLVVSLWCLVGCSHYSFSAAAKTHLSSIAVPILENETLEYGAELGVTDALIEQFTTDNTLRVVGEDEADSTLRGTVVVYERLVMSYDAGGNPLEYKVRIVAALVYQDVTRGETVWEGEVEGWAVYSAVGESGELTTEEEARERAFEKLSEDVFSKTVQGW